VAPFHARRHGAKKARGLGLRAFFWGVLDGDSYAITVLRQNVSAAVTFIFLFAVHEVLV
jgi:hypothetical protein